MNEPTQLPLLEEQTIQMRSPSIRYVPPTPDELDQYADQLCCQMEQSREQLPSIELIQGFATFIKTVVKIKTKALNKGVEYDAEKAA
jgi:hypothetical protein